MLFTNNNETILPDDGFEYERYHVSNHLYKTLLRPAGPLRLAGCFTILTVSPPCSSGRVHEVPIERTAPEHKAGMAACGR